MLIYLSFFMAVGLYLSSMFLKKGRRVGVGLSAHYLDGDEPRSQPSSLAGSAGRRHGL